LRASGSRHAKTIYAKIWAGKNKNRPVSGFFTKITYSRGQKKAGQCFFANINLLALSMVTIKIFIYLLQ
jgi:hypothetical protein